MANNESSSNGSKESSSSEIPSESESDESMYQDRSDEDDRDEGMTSQVAFDDDLLQNQLQQETIYRFGEASERPEIHSQRDDTSRKRKSPPLDTNGTISNDEQEKPSSKKRRATDLAVYEQTELRKELSPIDEPAAYETDFGPGPKDYDFLDVSGSDDDDDDEETTRHHSIINSLKDGAYEMHKNESDAQQKSALASSSNLAALSDNQYIPESTSWLCNVRRKHDKIRRRRLTREEAQGKGDNGESLSQLPAPQYVNYSKWNEPYRQLLNEDINSARNYLIYDFEDLQPLENSYIHETFWTREEKTTFFRVLPRTGKDNVEALANAVRTKTMIECRAYIQELQDGIKQRATRIRKIRKKEKFSHRHVPAAVEVPEECIRLLDIEANRLERYARKAELDAEKKKFGQHAIISADLAYNLDKMSVDEDEKTESSNMTSVTNLLHSDMLLTFSERIFMTNEHDFRNHAKSGRYPQVRNQALIDLARLVESVTRRLVQVALFQTTSRLRAKSRKASLETKPAVEPKDVWAALDIIGMTHNAGDYWRHVSRRCKLRVYDEPRHTLRNRASIGVPAMSYDAVEEKLQIYKDLVFEPPSEEVVSWAGQDQVLAPSSDDEEEESFRGDESISSDSGYQFDDDRGRDVDGYNNNNQPEKKHFDKLFYEKENAIYKSYFYNGQLPVYRPNLARLKKRLYEDFVEDEYLEYIDQKASLEEQKSLWIILGAEKERLDEIDAQLANLSIVEIPPIRQQTDFQDWREEFGVHPIWEQKFYPNLWKTEQDVKFEQQDYAWQRYRRRALSNPAKGQRRRVSEVDTEGGTGGRAEMEEESEEQREQEDDDDEEEENNYEDEDQDEDEDDTSDAKSL